MSGDAGASGSGGGGGGSGDGGRPSRYESQKRRDWNTFVNYLHNYSPAVGVGTCTGMHVVDFLRYLDQFGKTKVHVPACAFFGRPNPAGPCACPLRQAWGSLDALVGRLRAAFDEHSAALANVHNNTNTSGNNNNSNNNNSNNPFAARPVRQYLRDVRDLQSRARGISYHKKKRRNPIPAAPAAQAEQQLQQQQQQQRQPHLHTRGYATAAAAADEISSGSSSADVDAPAPAPAPPSATASYMMTMHGLR